MTVADTPGGYQLQCDAPLLPLQRAVLLGVAAGLGFGISDVAIKALSGDLDSGPAGLLSPWSAIILSAAVFSFYASARSLQIGDRLGDDALILVGAVLIPAPVRAGDALHDDAVGADIRTSPA